MNKPSEPISPDFSAFIPREIGTIVDHQTDLPRIAKDAKATAAIEACLAQIPSRHDLHRGDARDLSLLRDESVHLVVTSPPYWTLKEYRDHPASSRPTKRIELAPFAVDEAFQGLAYASRYERVCARLVRERLYDAACFFTSDGKGGLRGMYNQPNDELSIRNFAISLHAHAAAFAKLK